MEWKKQLQIENSGFVKPYREQIKYQITENVLHVFLEKKIDPKKGC